MENRIDFPALRAPFSVRLALSRAQPALLLRKSPDTMARN